MDYLRKAQRAEETSFHTFDPNLKKRWLDIAKSYRALAEAEPDKHRDYHLLDPETRDTLLDLSQQYCSLIRSYRRLKAERGQHAAVA